MIVGGTPDGRGVVAAASYEARGFGVHSAMPTARAVRLCPNAIVLPPRLDHYAQVSQQIREIFYRYTPLIEPLSLDEAFLDVTGSESLFGSAIDIGHRIKTEIRSELQLVVSVGIAPNKFLAKLASDHEKPDGLVVVNPNCVQQFLDPLPVGRLWGVGRATSGIFERLQAKTVGDVRRLTPEMLEQYLGEHGNHLWALAHGQDHREVVPDRQAKSISHETTFAQDILDLDALRAWSLELTEQVARRMRRHDLRGRTIQLKVRFNDFTTISRSTTLQNPTNGTRAIWNAVSEILLTRLPTPRPPVRLLGVGVTAFDAREHVQKSLFNDDRLEEQNRLDAAADQIRDRFGTDKLGRASGMLHDTRRGKQINTDDLRKNGDRAEP